MIRPRIGAGHPLAIPGEALTIAREGAAAVGGAGGDGHTDRPARTPASPAGNDQRVVRDPHDLLVHQVFQAGLELHSALDVSTDRQTVEKIHHAIAWLDQAIKDLRTMLFEPGRHATSPSPPADRAKAAAGPGNRPTQ